MSPLLNDESISRYNMQDVQRASFSRLAIIIVVFLMLSQSILITTDSNTDVLADDSDWFEGMVDDEENNEDFSMGGYNLLSNRWWQPSANRFNVTVNDSDGDGWDNVDDWMPNNPAIPAPKVPSNCAEFRPTCSLQSEGFAGMDAPDFVIPQAHTMEMGLGDFDGDGDLDFARSGSNHKVAIFTNENGSSFSEEKYDWGHGQRDSTAMAWADIDNDGDLDLTSGNSKWTFKATDQIFLNENGTFSSRPQYETADEIFYTKDVEWGLLTDDPYPDMVVSDQSGYLGFYANFGDGFKLKPENYSYGQCYDSQATCIVFSIAYDLTPDYTGFNSPNGHDVELVDLDLDGDLDIIVGTEENFKVIRNDGFHDHDDFDNAWLTIPNATQEVAIGDLNGDDLPEIVIGGSMATLKAYHNLGDMNFALIPLWESDEPADATGLELVDMDSDGDLDLVAAFGSSKNGIFINRGGFLETTPSWESEKSQETLSVEVGDIDGDGDNDVIFGNADLSDEVYLNHDRTVEKNYGWTDGIRASTYVVKSADVNNDGFEDLFQGNVFMTGDESSGDNHHDFLFYGTEDGLEDTPRWTSNVSVNTLDADWIDIDLDGDFDLYVATSDQDMIFTNEDGNLSTDPSWISPYSSYSIDVEVADFNDDGMYDVVIANSESSAASHIYLCCDSSGELILWWTGLENRSSSSVDVGDLDGDGLVDLLFTNSDWGSTAFHNDGTAFLFPENHTQTLAWAMTDAAIADLNDDGCNDVVYADGQFPNRITFCNGTVNGLPTYRNSGSGWTGWGGSFDVEVGDMDADGDLDVIWAEVNRPLVITIFENGAPLTRWKSEVVLSPRDIEIADVTGDGGLDIVAAMMSLSENVVFESRTDGDGDWVSDELDAFPLDPTQSEDWDGDGFGDHDMGKLPDSCTLYRGDSWRDRWGCPDMDSDGQSDLYDAFITQSTQWSDVDGDGFGDNWVSDGLNQTRSPNWPGQWIAGAYLPDPSPFDFDNDGYEDASLEDSGAITPFDVCPLRYGSSINDFVGCIDSDGDGWSDDGDDLPNEPTQYQDSDGDGWGDDPDGMRADQYPSDTTQWQDTDGDGYGDNQAGTNPDAYPLDPTQFGDFDGDGYGDSANGSNPDSCPSVHGSSFRDLLGCVDLDGDGWSNLSDIDDGNSEIWSDLDGDGFYDQPGFVNSDDCVNQAGTSQMPWRGCSDIDGDGIMDLADLDADGDGVFNADELQAGGAEGTSYDIFNASSTPSDIDYDGLPDSLDDDKDGDGFPNGMEKERGSDPNDADSTPMNLYGDASTGIFYVPGEGFKSSYDSDGYEISVSLLVDILTSEMLIPLLMIPITFMAMMRKRFRYRRFRKRLEQADSMDDLEGAEEALDKMITKRKLKVEQAMLLRNQLERMWVDYDEEPDSDMGRGSGGFDSSKISSSEVQKSGRY
jgi:hypothetical protein